MFRRYITQLFTLLITLVSISMSPAATANFHDVQIDTTHYSGTACPSGSVTTRLDPDTAKLYVYFNQYVVEAHGRNQRTLRKTCQLHIPIKVPEGVSISLVDAHYLGDISLPAGSHARIMNVFSFSGTRGTRFKTEFHGPSRNQYSLRDPLSSLANVWSVCGKDTTLRIITSTRVKTQGSRMKSHADSQRGFVTQLRYRSCQ